MWSITLLARILTLVLVSGERLNKFVSHFEPLNYDINVLENRHQRVRRSLDKESTLHLDFKAHGRSFKLRLKRDLSIFDPNLVVEKPFDPNKMYKGHVEDYRNSYVHGFVHHGVLEGKVKLSDKLEDEFHIEPSSDHFKTKKDYHSVIYKASDLHYPHSYGKDLDLREKTKKWMEKARRLPKEDFKEPIKSIPHRYRRENSNPDLICQIHLRADHLFTEKRAGKSKERALLLMAKHVQAVHEIFKETVFTIDGSPKNGYGFAIKRMRANDTADEFKTPNPYSQNYISVEKFLDIISLEQTSSEDGNRFCLSHVFTYRDFEDGVLGLAWRASPAGGDWGGICEVARTFRDGSKKTLNTGVVTFINYNEQVPSRISEITFAHELGHNFGAMHDNFSDCGNTSNGNYIMFRKATSGTDSNNRKFSTCSRDYISAVLQTKAASCFKPMVAAICGNKVIEDGEECDCGFKEDCTNDECCNHAESGTDRCKLKAGKHCSPSQGLCCDRDTCEYLSNTTICESGECIEDTYCNSVNAVCATPVNKPDNVTECNENKSLCISGECTGSRCLKFGKMECQCTKAEHQCLLCCLEGKTCSPHNESGQTPTLHTGAPCNNSRGYCDDLLMCRDVGSDRPLKTDGNVVFVGKAIKKRPVIMLHVLFILFSCGIQLF